MRNSAKGLIIFLGIMMVAFMIGDFVMKAAFFGTLMLAGVIAMINSMPWLKKLVTKGSKAIDAVITITSVIAMAYLGLNLTAATTVAAFGYTLVYAPYLRENVKPKQLPMKRNARNNYDCR